MKIGFDGKRAVQNLTGLGNYSRFVVEVLSRYIPENKYVLFAPKRKKNARLRTLQASRSVKFFYPQTLIGKLLPSLWRLCGIKYDLKKSEVSVFHGLSGEIPLGIHRTGIRTVVTIHDLIFLRFPEYYKPIDRLIYKLKFRYACRRANRIIAISECTKRDIMHYFAIPEEKISVIYQGCDEAFRQTISTDQKSEVAKRYSLPKKFILYVGTVERRKNLMLIANALKLLPEEYVLAVVGRRTAYQTEVEQFVADNGLSARVKMLGSVPFADLPTLYSLATVFVYPSLYEGFGIPIIEALWQGVPTIATMGSCLEEAGGAYSLYVNPDDAPALASYVRCVWTDPDFASRMAKAGFEYVQKFSDDKLAKQLSALYVSLA